jgi:hypothetical protein
MKIRGRVVIALATTTLMGGLASPVLAADTVTVDATVTIDAPCLTVSTETIDFGRLRFSGTIFPTIATRALSYASCSGSQELVFARGTDAVEAGGGPAGWQLGDLLDGCWDGGIPNIFMLDLDDAEGRHNRRLSTTDQQADSIAPASTGVYSEASFWAPCQGSDGTGSTMTFQIILTATF